MIRNKTRNQDTLIIREAVNCKMLAFHLLENCGTPVLSSHFFTVLPGDRSPGGVGIWGAVGLATVNKHTGREGLFCWEFHRKE